MASDAKKKEEAAKKKAGSSGLFAGEGKKDINAALKLYNLEPTQPAPKVKK